MVSVNMNPKTPQKAQKFQTPVKLWNTIYSLTVKTVSIYKQSIKYEINDKSLTTKT